MGGRLLQCYRESAVPQVCGFVGKMPTGLDTSSLWLRGQDPGWDISSFVASQSRSWLGPGYLKFVVSWAGSRLGYLKFGGFAVKIPVGIRQVLWLCSQDPGWDTSSSWLCGPEPGWDTSSLRPGWKNSSFLVSRSRSRLGYLKFVASWSRPRLEYFKPQVCGFAVRTPAGIPPVCGFVVRIPCWYTSSFVASPSRSRLGYLKFVASWPRSRLGYLNFPIVAGLPQVLWLRGQEGFAVTGPVEIPQVCGFLVRMPVRIPEVLWDTLCFAASQSGSRLGYLKFCGFGVKIPVGKKFCGVAIKIPFGILAAKPQKLRHPNRDLDSEATKLEASQPGS